METSVLFETIIVAIADSLADADHMKLVALVAPLAFTDDYSFLLGVLIGKCRICVLDENYFAVEVFLFDGKCRTDDGLQRLTGKFNTRIPFNISVSCFFFHFCLITFRDLLEA